MIVKIRVGVYGLLRFAEAVFPQVRFDGLKNTCERK